MAAPLKRKPTIIAVVLGLAAFISTMQIWQDLEDAPSPVVTMRTSTNSGIPEYCQTLIGNPRPFRYSCRPRSSDFKCSDNRTDTVMFSQFAQDVYLFTKHFIKKTSPGVYVDIATNDPITISNTFFMDRCLNWKGICVEPLEQFIPQIRNQRSCHLVPTCVGSKEGENVTFNVNGGLSGIVGDTYKFQGAYVKSNDSQVTSLTCTTMKKVLQEQQISTIDYMSLDVEGHELEVVNGMGLEDIVIRVLTVENSSPALHSLLISHGYRLLLDGEKPVRLGDYVIYLHKSVTFGSPE